VQSLFGFSSFNILQEVACPGKTIHLHFTHWRLCFNQFATFRKQICINWEHLWLEERFCTVLCLFGFWSFLYSKTSKVKWLQVSRRGTYQLNVPKPVQNLQGLDYQDVEQVGFEQAGLLVRLFS
jgi:hypothetical protein